MAVERRFSHCEFRQNWCAKLIGIGVYGGCASKVHEQNSVVTFETTIFCKCLQSSQRFAESVASVAMPNTQNTPEYAAFRKLQVYEAALAEALPDGNISERERELLNRLRDSAGISAVDADALEAELQEGRPSLA